MRYLRYLMAPLVPFLFTSCMRHHETKPETAAELKTFLTQSLDSAAGADTSGYIKNAAYQLKNSTPSITVRTWDSAAGTQHLNSVFIDNINKDTLGTFSVDRNDILGNFFGKDDSSIENGTFVSRGNPKDSGADVHEIRVDQKKSYHGNDIKNEEGKIRMPFQGFEFKYKK